MADLSTLPTHSSSPQRIPSVLKWVLFPPPLFSQLHSFASSRRKPRGPLPSVSLTLMLSCTNVKTEKTYKKVKLKNPWEWCVQSSGTHFLWASLEGVGGHRISRLPENSPTGCRVWWFGFILQEIEGWVRHVMAALWSLTEMEQAAVLFGRTGVWYTCQINSYCENLLASIADFFFF